MAAYAAVISLQHTITRLILSIPSSEHEILKGARQEIESLQQVLEILDKRSGIKRDEKAKTLELVKPQLSKRFASKYPVVHFVFNDVVSLETFLFRTRVDAADQRIRKAVAGFLSVLQSLVSNLMAKHPPHQTIQRLNRAKKVIRTFTEMVININDAAAGNKPKEKVRLSDEFPKASDLLRELKEYADHVFTDLETVFRRLDMNRSNSSRKRVNDLEVQIREAVCELEDFLETRCQSDDQESIDAEYPPSPFPIELREVEIYINPFIQLVKKLKQEYMNELVDPLPEEEDDILSSREFLCKNKSRMVGLYDEVDKIKNRFTERRFALKIVPLAGMAGIGKTTVAKHVFQDPSLLKCFDVRAWVEVGPNYKLKDIVQSIVAQVNRDNIDELTLTGERLENYMHRSLKRKRYLIVLDDVWERSVWVDIKRIFPDDNNKSVVLLTTRLCRVASGGFMHEMRFLSKEESWDLLREKVFDEESSCPPLLEKIGKKIAESCEGLPLTIVTVGELLSKVEKTPQNWTELAKNPNRLLAEAYDQMLKVLLPSYYYLPQYLKACFLFMGVFPRNHEITRSELIMLWTVDTLFHPSLGNYGIFTVCIDLVESHILKPGRKSLLHINKTWSLHSSFWHLCRREASKNKFFHVMESFGDISSPGIEGQRRLCVHNNVLLSIKDVHKKMASISTIRSLLFTGQPHQYPVPLCFGFSLLRILKAITIRLYEFPVEVLKLVELRYLSLTCLGNLPTSISKLRNIQFIIIRRHLSICTDGALSYLPKEIWDMKELKHLQIMGSDLPDPGDGSFLPNLKTLLDISARSCTSSVFQGLPELEKLGIRIEVAPDDYESFHCFDHINFLKKLESLKCVVVNPTFSYQVIKTPHSFSMVNFPPSLRKLSLSGFGYPWEDTRVIASLPNLRALKLRCYAFRGPKWEIEDNGFPRLDILMIEDTDLVHWTVGSGSLQWLECLILKNCYKLEDIQGKFSESLESVEIVDCNVLAVNYAKQLQNDNSSLELSIHSSWDDGKLK